MACGRMVVDTLPSRGASPQPRQVGFGRRFIQKHQRASGGLRKFTSPQLSRRSYVFPILLAGAECLFLYVRFIAARA